MEINRETAKTAMNIVPFLDMSGELPWIVDYKTTKKVVSKLLEKDFRMTKDDLVNCFVSLGTDWNLLSKRLLDGIIGTIRNRLSVRMQGMGDCDQIRTVEGLPFCWNILEAKVDDMKQYSKFEEGIGREAKIIYISGSN